MDVLEDHDERLDETFAEEEPPAPVQRPLAALLRVERLPGGIVRRHAEEREERGHEAEERLVQREELPPIFSRIGTTGRLIDVEGSSAGECTATSP